MSVIEKSGVFTYVDKYGNEVRLFPKSKNETADIVLSVLNTDFVLDETTGLYKQDFALDGFTEETIPVIGLVPTSVPTLESEAEAYSHLVEAVTSENCLSLYADEIPSVSVTIIIKGINASSGSTVTDISNLTKAYNELSSSLSITRATLTAGETEITIADTRIDENSILSFYASIYGISPTAVVVNAGSVTLTFDAQETDMEVGVSVDG